MRKQSIRTYLSNTIALPYIVALTVVALAMIVGVSMGSSSIPLSTVVHIFIQNVFSIQTDQLIDESMVNIVMSIRLPRVLLAFCVGASLALAGAAFQGLLKNPLADPYTLGVSSGASLGAVIVIFFHIQLPFIGSFTLPVISICAAFVTLLLVLFFARMADRKMSVETLILAGIIFSAFLGAVLSLVIALSGEELRQIMSWLMGSVSMRGWAYIQLIVPFLVVSFVLLLFCTRELNALSFGEESASHLGVNVNRTKWIVLISASMLTGAAVAVAGTIGFVGLVIPHLTRMVWGANHVRLLPLSMLYGGAFLIIADLVARTIIAPTELPIGVITAFIGAPIFSYIFFRRRRRKEG
ncbi:FecCD family ABC transporter permease [Priestia taiwanensis]|uniref:ABC transporter permease protein YvrB n=1 Tax=Priestia taiwanensis TaxID=1347902 RepID=A0A917AK75_9BACI|nr:iron ABC transporter permease [Priestia taiwanensis]MBM7361589.1 iron complex transport system permease protein [Priestia taiwanensis]GGE55337.1 putative ABC transporter permease protein YvrB [Priestia taiwanensis]